MKPTETGLKIKSYFAATVTEAITNARHELGPEAMLVTTRRTGPEARQLGEYEVVFALMPRATPNKPPLNPEYPSTVVLSPAKGMQTHSRTPTMEHIALGDATKGEAEPTAPLRPVLKRLRDAVGGTRERSGVESPFLRAAALLRSTGLEEDLCREISRAVKQDREGTLRALKKGASGEPDQGRLEAANQAIRSAIARELKTRLLVGPALGRPDSRRRIVALVGPPGAGKTTTLVKLAVRYGLAARRSLHLISVDNYRIGAAEQLRTYAGAVGCGCDVADSVSSLTLALESRSSSDLILIDTPGLGAADVAPFTPLASFLSSSCDIEVQLVLPAHASAQNLARISRRFRPFLPSRLIFTNLDEAESTGAVLAEALRTELPVSYLGTGQLIPEDLEEADSETLVGRFISAETFAAASAA